MSFDDFVNRVGAEDQARKKWESEKPQRLAKWRADCDPVYAEIERLLQSTLHKGVLKAKYGDISMEDPDFFGQRCRIAIYELGDRSVTLVPKWSAGAGFNGILEFRRQSRKPDMGVVRVGKDDLISDWKLLHETPKPAGRGIPMGQTDHNLSELNQDNPQKALQYLLS